MRSSLPRRATRTATLAVSTCAVIALTACSGSSGSASGGETLSYEDSPLTQWYESFADNEDFDQASMDDYSARIEESIASCMQEEGFDYIPSTGNSGFVVAGGDDDEGPEWGTKEFAAQYGYQAFTMYAEPMDEEGEEVTDPNQENYEAMSDGEKAAYDLALYGDMTRWEDEDFDPNDLAPEEMGCQDKAYRGTSMSGDEDDFWNSEEMQAFQDEMSDYFSAREDAGDDPAMSEPNGKWADCMAEAGYGDKGWTKPSEPESWFQDEANNRWEEAYEGIDEESTEEDAPDPTTSDEWKKMAEEEKDTAVADFTCREDSGWSQASLKAEFAAEQAFIDEHKAQMDQLVALYEESKK